MDWDPTLDLAWLLRYRLIDRNVKVHAPFSLDLEEHGTHFTNFDSTGRYLVVLEKFNVVREHEQPIQVKRKEI